MVQNGHTMAVLRFLGLTALLAVAVPVLAEIPLSAPAPAAARMATVQVRVAPDRADWTYRPGDPVTFAIIVTADGHGLAGAVVRYRVGPDMMPVDEQVGTADDRGIVMVRAGTLAQPGFIRCAVTCEFDGRVYRGVATAGFSPEEIQPTQVNPADFDDFWARQIQALAELPVDATLTPQPELSTGEVEVFHVSLQNVSAVGRSSRLFGILCVPRGEGQFPAVLRVPGAGVRPYRGNIEYAARGFITLEIGIHGVPVNLPADVYSQLGSAALAHYPVAHLEDRERYYYRRVYLGCLRANDFLTAHPKWDGRNLVVMGGSQGGQLSIVTAALDRRVTALAAVYPAYCDVTGYVHGRAGGWPHMMREARDGHRTPEKLATTSYYDVVNFARRLRVPGIYLWGYNDVVCPPTSMYAAYNVIPAPKRLELALDQGHQQSPEMSDVQLAWILGQVKQTP
jgi:cephalosporin-C deacetylase